MTTVPKKPPRPSKAKVVMQSNLPEDNESEIRTTSSLSSAGASPNVTSSLPMPTSPKPTVFSRGAKCELTCESSSSQGAMASSSAQVSDIGLDNCSVSESVSKQQPCINVKLGDLGAGSGSCSDILAEDPGYATVDDINAMVAEAECAHSSVKPQIKPKPLRSDIQNVEHIAESISPENPPSNASKTEVESSLSKTSTPVSKSNRPNVAEVENRSAIESAPTEAHITSASGPVGSSNSERVIPVYATVDKAKKKAATMPKCNASGASERSLDDNSRRSATRSSSQSNDVVLRTCTDSPVHTGSKESGRLPPKKPPRTFAHSEYMQAKTLKAEMEKHGVNRPMSEAPGACIGEDLEGPNISNEAAKKGFYGNNTNSDGAKSNGTVQKCHSGSRASELTSIRENSVVSDSSVGDKSSNTSIEEKQGGDSNNVSPSAEVSMDSQPGKNQLRPIKPVKPVADNSVTSSAAGNNQKLSKLSADCSSSEADRLSSVSNSRVGISGAANSQCKVSAGLISPGVDVGTNSPTKGPGSIGVKNTGTSVAITCDKTVAGNTSATNTVAGGPLADNTVTTNQGSVGNTDGTSSTIGGDSTRITTPQQHRRTSDKLPAPPRPSPPSVPTSESVPAEEPFRRNAVGSRMSERSGLRGKGSTGVLRTRSVAAKVEDTGRGKWDTRGGVCSARQTSSESDYALISDCIPSTKGSTSKKGRQDAPESDSTADGAGGAGRATRATDGSATLPVSARLMASVKRHNSEVANNTYRHRMVAQSKVSGAYSVLRENLVLLESGETELLSDDDEGESQQQAVYQSMRLKHVSCVRESTAKSINHYSTVVKRSQRQPISSQQQQSSQPQQQKDCRTQLTAERALIIALKPASILCSATGCNEPTNRFVPYILRDSASATVINSGQTNVVKESLIDLRGIERLCFPDADLWRPVTIYRGDTLAFQLLEDDGSRRYGYCRRYLPGSTSLNRLPESFCALSRVPVPQSDVERLLTLAEEKFCLQTDVVAADGVTAEQLQGLLQQLQLQQNLQTIRSQALMADRRQTLKAARLGDGGLERTYIESLISESWSNSSLLVQIFSDLILERNIILVSQNLSSLSQVTQALMSLTEPFEWQHEYVACLPLQMIDSFFCQSPQLAINSDQLQETSLGEPAGIPQCAINRTAVPYVVGLLSSTYAQLIQREGFDKLQALVVDVDRGSVVRCYDDEDLVLPSKLRKALLTSLSVDTESGIEVRKLVVREAFLRFFIETCGHYSEYICTQQDGQAVFEREAFVKAVCSPSIRLFLDWFTCTQMFEMFIINELHGDKHNMFEMRVLEYREEMAELSSSLKHNVLQVGKKIKDFFVESGDRLKKRIQRTVYI